MRVEKDIKANKKLTVIFFIIMLLAILSTLARHSGKKKVQSVPGDSGYAGPADTLATVRVQSTRQVSTLVPHEDWGIDPFTPVRKRKSAAPVRQTSRASTMKLSGILNDGVHARAVINGKVYTTGSQISDYVVESICSDRVVLRKGNRTIMLTL